MAIMNSSLLLLRHFGPLSRTIQSKVRPSNRVNDVFWVRHIAVDKHFAGSSLDSGYLQWSRSVYRWRVIRSSELHVPLPCLHPPSRRSIGNAAEDQPLGRANGEGPLL